MTRIRILWAGLSCNVFQRLRGRGMLQVLRPAGQSGGDVPAVQPVSVWN